MPFILWQGQDSNLRPSGYEPDELPAAPPRDLRMTKIRKYEHQHQVFL